MSICRSDWKHEAAFLTGLKEIPVLTQAALKTTGQSCIRMGFFWKQRSWMSSTAHRNGTARTQPLCFLDGREMWQAGQKEGTNQGESS